MVAFDYQGVGVIITAVFAGVASVIAAWNARSGAQIKRSISTNGDPREMGKILSDLGKVMAPAPAEPAEPTATPPASPALPPPALPNG